MKFPTGTKVKYNKSLLIAHGDSREGLIGYVMPYSSRSSSQRVQEKTPVKFPESSNLWYLDPADLEEIKTTKQEEMIPTTFYAADREAAKAGLAPLQLAYVERLEMALRAADEYYEAMNGFAHSPAQHSLENNLLIQMSKVNFLSSCDHIKREENELPRDVIFK